MKKTIVAIVSVFTVTFCLVSVVLPRHKADLYSVLYPKNVSIETAVNETEIKLKKEDCFVLGSMYGEPIVWRLIDEEDLLAWSENAVCFKAFDAESSDWSNSDLKEWLNDDSGFLTEDNFSSESKRLIANVNGDKMFLLSKNELQKIPQSERAKAPTVSAIENDGSKKLVIRKNCWYWTASSISTNTSSVSAVTQTGGFYKSLASDELVGVCPAFYLKDLNVMAVGGNGTKEKPYVLCAGGEGE